MTVKIGRCRSCNESVVWMLTEAGRRMPVDADSVDEADLEFTADNGQRIPLFNHKAGHISHFSTCPDADQHRRRR